MLPVQRMRWVKNGEIFANHGSKSCGALRRLYWYGEQRNLRDWRGNITTTDGQHAIFHCIQVTADATVDGFTIINGQANGAINSEKFGGGMCCTNCSPLIENCTGADLIWDTADDDYGNLRLQPASPCIDTGTSNNAPAYDMDGKNRTTR